MKTQWTRWRILLKDPSHRKPVPLGVDTVDMDSDGIAINIILIITPDDPLKALDEGAIGGF